MITQKEFLIQKLKLQAAFQDGLSEIVFSISEEEKNIMKTFTVAELKSIPDFGAQKVIIDVIGE